MISKQTHEEVMDSLESWGKTWIPDEAKRKEAIGELLEMLAKIPGNRSYMDTMFNLLKDWKK